MTDVEMTGPDATVAVLGLGTTGSAIAAALARAGRRVVAVEADDTALARGRARVEELTGPDGGDIAFTTATGRIADAELVIEAVPESAALKIEVLRAANTVCPPATVFVTTTTALPVAEIAAGSGRMARTTGLHLADPASGTVAEVVTTPVTDADAQDGTLALARALGRTPVRVGDRAGFIGGALTMGYLNGAATMFERRHGTRDDIDAAMMLGCGLPLGPLAQLDRMGLDVAHDTLRILYERTGDRRYAPSPVLAHMAAAGLLGRKSGRGFYDYGEAGEGAGGDTGTAATEPAGEEGAARPVRRVGVVGSGTMAAGIAEVCARAGLPTVLVARTDVRAKEALAAVERSLERRVRRGKVSAEDVAATMARLSGASRFDALTDRDLVIEAVVEDLKVKRETFRSLDEVCRPGTVLATTTSSLPVIECATATSRPHDVVGMHFFNPAPAMKLVELVRTALTGEQALATARALCAALGKRPVDCADRTGFIANALLFPYLNHAVTMLQDGHATADDIDAVMTQGLGLPMGPLQLLDVVGLDVSLAIQRELHAAHREPALTPARLLEELVLAGYTGRKAGRGFRAHEPR
ncbi:3-hydroxybutyryl-CoA dehydrogenase [Actinomadura pelletieri DSM 43383]|uniref:3-hydroxybutyryl-CoA dehydrogenase n=1 Tax=Actinomadura pelletieri DSM 43383 TaxID=1120940 RepID=A0A495Q9R9_9ACTN|nr:3-hydroxyacyl-CoA dehydrogenase family protein [Actinomadura pelletieri]RKS68202.1 3-hydroxybutyryl-CoA dehydrogenase [Actinomadura pelletieri DSM 43383]